MKYNIEEGINREFVHIPVLWREIVSYMESSNFLEDGKIADCTLGEGGHSEIILKNYKNIKITAFERDPNILEISRKRLEIYGDRISFINDNFSNMSEYLNDSEKLNLFLFDFGISSYHFDKSGRGFTFSKDEPLDMRLDNSSDKSAKDIINNCREKELADIFYNYGDERWSRRIARKICEKRKEKLIETTEELAQIVLGSIPKKFHVKNIHPATRVFQALRIYVNKELDSIKKGLQSCFEFLSGEGLIMAISFHSLEDRIVKDWFKRMARGCTCELEPKHCMCYNKPFIKILTKKPVVPGDDEIRINNRSRSAKLRVCEKL